MSEPHLRQTVSKYYPKNATFPKEIDENLCVCVCMLLCSFLLSAERVETYFLPQQKR